MRPLLLKAKNFRGYATLELDLREVRSVLICGETGAGKSNIVGAIFLALTGENDSSDPIGHIKKGADGCQVRFEFEHHGSIYRIIHTDSIKATRKRTDRQIAVRVADGSWLPKSGKTLAETNAIITGIVGMGANELLCGPLSLQDRSSLFVDPPELRIDGTVYKGRSARLQVTVKMLGLSLYEQFRQAAMQQARELEAKAETLEAQLAEIDRALRGDGVGMGPGGHSPTKREQVQGQLTEAETLIQRVLQDAQEAQASKDALEAELQVLSGQIATAEAQTATLPSDRTALATLGESLATKQTRATDYRALLSRRAEIEAQATEAAALDARLAQHRQDLAGVAATEKGLAEQVATAERRRNIETSTRAGETAAKLAEARDRVSHRPAIEDRRDRLGVLRREREVLRGQLAQRRPALATLDATIQSLGGQFAQGEPRRRAAQQRATDARARLQAAETALAQRETLTVQVNRLQSARLEREACAARIQTADEQITAQRAELDRLTVANHAATTRRGEILAEERRVTAEKSGLQPQIIGHENRVAVMGTVPCIGMGDVPDRCPLLADAHESSKTLQILYPEMNSLCAWQRPELPEIQPTTNVLATLHNLAESKRTELLAHQALDEEIATLTPSEGLLASLETTAATLPQLIDDRDKADDAATREGRGVALLMAQIDETRAAHTPLGIEIMDLERRQTFCDTELATLDGVEAELATMNALAATIPGLEVEATTAAEAHQAATKALDELRTALDGAQQRYLSLQIEIARAETTRAALVEAVALASCLVLADRELPALETELTALLAQRTALVVKVESAQAAEARLHERCGQRAKVTVQIGYARGAIVAGGDRERAAIEQAAQHRATLGHLDALQAERDAAAAEAATLRARHPILLALVDAYRQIPILILDTVARPVLEEEANRFLAGTSRNRMQVRIETQREVKSRETLADGLEIYVRDWRGERSLDEYSGGQKFELYLAFRIAWTRLQERRSGVGIDMLLIDEGFGALSPGDLQAVMEALREVQDEFGFLAVISHVETMRDLFSARVQVTGGTEDSQAELVMA